MSNDHDIQYYFDSVETEDDGLQEIPFGEFLVEKRQISRAQLLAALIEQDQNPGVRLGEVIAFLGILPAPKVDRLLREWNSLPVVEI
jgi:hypothetical protein